MLVGRSGEEPGSEPGPDTLDMLMEVQSIPLDPNDRETLPVNLPADFSPGPSAAEELPSSSSGVDDIDRRILELEFLGWCEI